MITRYTYSKNVTVILVDKVMQINNGEVVIWERTRKFFI